tara:strand:+ start:287 stop:622 length:336 start_codon:yes stop_codon:yes gene_type:complete
MSEYTPDSWVVLKIVNESETFYKVLGGWSGGYLEGSSWRMNSGITSLEAQAHLYGFYGSSGSVYWCHKGAYRLTMDTSGVYNQLKVKFGDAIELMPEDTDWSEVNWKIDTV